MEIILTFIAGLLSIFLFERIVRWLSRREARKQINAALKKADRPDNDLSYLGKSIIEKGAAENPPNMKLRFALVTPFGIGKTSLRNRVLPISLELARHGHNIRVFLPPSHDLVSDPQIQPDDLKPVGIEIGRVVPHIPMLDFLMESWQMFWAISKFRPDFVYGFKPLGHSAIITLAIYALRRIPYFGRRFRYTTVWVDCDDWEGIGGWADRQHRSILMRVLRDRFEKWAIRFCDHVTVTSDELLHLAYSLRGKARSVKKLKNSIEVSLWPPHDVAQRVPDELQERLRPLEGYTILLFYTRFLEVSSQRLIDIFAEVLRTCPKTALLIVGSSLDQASRIERLRLPMLAREAGIDPSLLIETGWVPYLELRHHWAPAKIAIFPYDDTRINRAKFPVKLLEALAAGKSVVAESVGEVSNIIKDKTQGILIESGNIQAFASEVIRLIQNRALQESLGWSANDMVHNEFDWADTVNELEEEIEKDVRKLREKEQAAEKSQKSSN